MVWAQSQARHDLPQDALGPGIHLACVNNAACSIHDRLHLILCVGARAHVKQGRHRLVVAQQQVDARVPFLHQPAQLICTACESDPLRGWQLQLL